MKKFIFLLLFIIIGCSSTPQSIPSGWTLSKQTTIINPNTPVQIDTTITYTICIFNTGTDIYIQEDSYSIRWFQILSSVEFNTEGDGVTFLLGEVAADLKWYAFYHTQSMSLSLLSYDKSILIYYH